MSKLIPIQRLTRPRRLPLLVAVVAVLTLTLSLVMLAGSRGPARPQLAAAPQHPAGLASLIPTSSGPAASQARSTSAATPTLTTSDTRHGPVSSSSATGSQQVTASGTTYARPSATNPPATRPRTSPHPPVSSPARPTRTSRPAPTPSPSPHVIGDGDLVSSTNSYRSAHGAGQLGYSSSLSADAKACALQMARTGVAHCGGNQVVAGAWSIGGCMDGFESDPAHRDILLSPAFSEAGSRVAVDAAGAYYCVINFG